MLVNTELSAQSEVGALGLCEARRSYSVPSQGGTSRPATRMRGTEGVGALRSARGTLEDSDPNLGKGTHGRRSTRRGLGSGARSNSSPTFAGGRDFGSDITNVRASRSSQAEKAKFLTKPNQHSFQPPTAAAALETPSADVPVDAVSQVTADTSQLAISKVETSNVQNVAEYVSDICNQFFRDEARFLATADYMERTQTDITGEDRAWLIDWVVGVHTTYCLGPETLHLTVNLIDRYLTQMRIRNQCLQLVGVVAMFIASKSEETSPPDSKYDEISPPELHSRRLHRPRLLLRDWVGVAANACTEDDILVMECTMLSALSFQIVVPTAANFFDVFAKANVCDAIHLEVARYILELGLLDLRSLQYNPSQMVAAALLLSNELFKRTLIWPTKMVQQTRHLLQSLGSCVEVLRELVEADQAGACPRQAVKRKCTAAMCRARAEERNVPPWRAFWTYFQLLASIKTPFYRSQNVQRVGSLAETRSTNMAR